MTATLGERLWILDELPVAVWVANVPDGTVAYVNKAFERVMSMPAVASSRIDDTPQTYGICGRDHAPYPVDRLPFSRVVAERQAVVVDDIVLRRPQGDVDIRAFGSPVFSPDGTMSHVIVAFFDVTAELLAQREREIAQERLAFVCKHAPIALWATDRSGKVTLSEGAALAELGVQPGQLVGQDLLELYAEHPTVPGHIRRALSGESFWYTTSDGAVTFESWIAPLRDDSGAMIGLAGLSKDVTEIRRLQNTVIQNDRVNAMGTLAASVAHEVNNPLTYMTVHGNAAASELDALERQLASADGPSPSDLRAAIGRIREELAPLRAGIEQIATITRDLRTFNRPDDAALAPTDLRQVIDAVLKLVRKEVEARASLVLELGDTPPVLGNHTRLVQVVLNMVMNAMHALGPSGDGRREIRLRTYAEDTLAVIEVSDSGPGVPAEDRQRVFDPFFTTKEIGQGTGLGLFVCRNIVRGLSGDVAVMDAPGGGALFRVTLPGGRVAPQAIPTQRPSLASTVGRHIVVIDDDALVLRALAAQLAHAGFRVTTASDGAPGLDILLNTADIDLVFCDLMMRGMTGMQLEAELSAKAPAIAHKLVFMTGGAFSPKAQDFVAKNQERTVGKPFDIVTEARRRLS